MGFSGKEYWSGLPFPSPGDLPDPGIETGSPALQSDSLPPEPPAKPIVVLKHRLFRPADFLIFLCSQITFLLLLLCMLFSVVHIILYYIFQKCFGENSLYILYFATVCLTLFFFLLEIRK